MHSMPGRREPLKQVLDEIDRLEVTLVVNLAPANEMRVKSPEYADAIRLGQIPSELRLVPIDDFRIPNDEVAFSEVAHEVSEVLQSGRNVLVHCGAGIGRTGTFAVAVLLELGMQLHDALKRVRDAGSGPETADQEWLVSHYRKNSRSGGFEVKP